MVEPLSAGAIQLTVRLLVVSPVNVGVAGAAGGAALPPSFVLAVPDIDQPLDPMALVACTCT